MSPGAHVGEGVRHGGRVCTGAEKARRVAARVGEGTVRGKGGTDVLAGKRHAEQVHERPWLLGAELGALS